jgi:DNA-directed RNA polymerase subunit RPC12/RpoP
MGGDKICIDCGLNFPVDKFKISARYKNKEYRLNFCRSCGYKRGYKKKLEWNRNNPDKILAQQQKTRKKYKMKLRKRAKEYVLKNPEKVKIRLEKSRFCRALYSSNIKAKQRNHIACIATEEEIKYIFTGKCFVCGVSESNCRVKLCLDHNHSTGKFRGWLCEDCNIAAGKLRDNPIIVQNLYKYLNKG